jgi:hypothetical protein
MSSHLSSRHLSVICTSCTRALQTHTHTALHAHIVEDSIADAMYTHTESMVHEMRLSRLWPAAGSWQFCAGGLQGFVGGRCVRDLGLVFSGHMCRQLLEMSRMYAYIDRA